MGPVPGVGCPGPDASRSDTGPSPALAAVRPSGAADEGTRARALAALAPHLTPKLLAKALAAVRASGSEGDRARALAGPGPPPDAEAARQSAGRGAGAGDGWARSEALAALGPRLTPSSGTERWPKRWLSAGDRARGGPGLGVGRSGPQLAEFGHPAERWPRCGQSGTRGPGPRVSRPGLPAGGVGPPGRGLAAVRAIEWERARFRGWPIWAPS